MITIRRAMINDLPTIVELAVESVSRDPLPVAIDRQAMMETGQTLLNPAHFLWVAERDGKICAAVAACVQRSFWFRGLQCSVLLYYTRVPGAGAKLLREFSRWVKSRHGIKVAVLELEPSTDLRMLRFLRRLGFDRKSMNMTYIRASA